MRRLLLAAVAVSVCLLQLLVINSGSARAQVENDSGAWLALFAQGDLPPYGSEQRLKWWFDGHARFFDDTDGFGQSIVRPGVGYRFGETATVWAGYGWIYNSPAAGGGFSEHRPWQQITWSYDVCGGKLGLRSRLEQRLVQTGSDTGWRFRQLVAYRKPCPCDSRFTSVIWDEAFFALNDTDWGANAGFDQNRLFIGGGFRRCPNSLVRVEVGYLNQYIYRPAGDDLVNHMISVNFFLSP